MRQRGWVAALLCLSACSSGSPQSAALVLKNPIWQRVTVEAVITKSDDCKARGAGYVRSETFEMAKDTTHKVEAPHGENICWRHDRDPDHPVKGEWSGWSRATLFPGQTAETDL